MKKIVLIFYIIISSVWLVKAQELTLIFNAPASGRNLAFCYILNNEKSDIGFGLRYNINTFAHPDDQMNMFHKRQYATSPLQHFGVQFYYNRFIWSRLFAFYDFQLSYSQTFNRTYAKYIYDPSAEEPYSREDILYKKILENFGPFTWLEQNIGIGLKLNITEEIFFTPKIGLGAMVLFGEDEQVLRSQYQMFMWEIGSIMSIGLSYKF